MPSEKELLKREITKIEKNNFYEDLAIEIPRESKNSYVDDRKTVQIKSTVQYLKENKQISDDFIAMFSTLTFEEILHLKLELVSNIVKNRLFGFALKRTLLKLFNNVVEDYAFTHFRTNRDVANFLGISLVDLKEMKLKRKRKKRPIKEYWK